MGAALGWPADLPMKGTEWLALRQESAQGSGGADGPCQGHCSEDASVQNLFIEYAPPSSRNGVITLNTC